MVATQARGSAGGDARVPHPVVPRLLSGLDLTSANLATLQGPPSLDRLRRIIANAEYWLSFDASSLDPLLQSCPTPLRELGVAIALRFGEHFGGRLTQDDLRTARTELLDALPPAIRNPVLAGVEILERSLHAREERPALEARGFKPYVATRNLSVHALRAGGKAIISIDGIDDNAIGVELPLGQEIRLAARGERGQALVAPEVESAIANAGVLVFDPPGESCRRIVFTVPGQYRLRVPGRATGDRKILAL
ncbi:MAG: hypothetical protein IPK13_18765 [Deltaproteobacteria bacterium]|nr:hypothetical protein [Deltaproteobacteria bacterium]